MRISTCYDDVVVWAPAKVNLFFEVRGKRPDGYHEIETLMVGIRLFDTLIFREAPDLSLQCSDARLTTGVDNLVLKAAKLLQDRTGCKKGARIRLVKRIPMEAGLAGGSTDAAATLLGLNQLWQLGISTSDLAMMGGEIGSDVPFFFHLPAAWCTGRGENVAPVKLPVSLDFVLLCPSFGVSTAAVYKNVVITPNLVSGAPIRAALAKGDVDLIAKSMHNRLQTVAERFEPRIAEFARMLADVTPAGSLMSGSGSTFFALCRSAVDANRLAADLKARANRHDFRLIVTRSV